MRSTLRTRRGSRRPNSRVKRGIPPPPDPPFDIETFEPIEPPWQAIREWIPDDDAEPSGDLFDQRPDSGKPVEIPREDGSTSSSIPTEATESTAPEKTAAEKMLGKAERIIILANNA